MPLELEIEKMSVEEKLRVMEALWADLSRNSQKVSSPAWHEELLLDRGERVRTGQEQFLDWDAAKRELRDRLL